MCYNTIKTTDLKTDYKNDVVEALTKSYKSFRFDYLTIAISIIVLLSIILFIPHNFLGGNKTLYYILVCSIVLIGIISYLLVLKWEQKRRLVTLFYEFDDGKDKHLFYDEILSALNKIAECKRIWSLISSQYLDNTYSSKINAGASNLVNRDIALCKVGRIPWVKTNISVPYIKTTAKTLYFVPDGILVYDTKGVAYVEYQNLDFDTDTTSFIEEYPPSDAQIIDYTWQYANVKGGPDLRFKNNRRIPICSYGELKIRTDKMLLCYILTSKEDAPIKFHQAMKGLLNKYF